MRCVFYALTLISILCVALEQLILINYKSFNEDKYAYITDQMCEQQWVPLNRHLYFRPQLAFFYIDLNKIKLYFERDNNLSNVSLQLDVLIRGKTVFNTSRLVYKEYHTRSRYKWMSLEVDFVWNENPVGIQVLLHSLGLNESMPNPIDLEIKQYQPIGPKKYSMLCSKMFCYGKGYAKSFEWWIELNKMHGYDKLVFFNNSIEKSPRFDSVFEKNKNFLEIIQLQCLPNFIDYTEDKKFIKSFHEFEKHIKFNHELNLHFEFITLNECYLSNMDKYDFISVGDQDESILPRRLEGFMKIDNRPLLMASRRLKSFLSNDYKCSQETSALQDFIGYLRKEFDNVEDYKYLNMSSNRNLTWHFKMGLYIPHAVMETFFKSLSKSLLLLDNCHHNNCLNNTKFEVDYMENLKFKFDIGDQMGLEYARYLVKFYAKVLKPFLFRNRQSLEEMPEQFNRFFFFHGASTATSFEGKTLHSTRSTNLLTTHYPEDTINNFFGVPMNYGFLSHFRENLDKVIYQVAGDIAVTDLKFDLNYFVCYYKLLAHKLGYEIDFKINL